MNTKLISLLLLITFSTALFTSCDKDEDGNIKTGSLSAKVDGKQWNATPFTTVGTHYKNSVAFAGIKGLGKIGLVIQVGKTIQAKKYDINYKLVTDEAIIIPKSINIGRFNDVKNPEKPDAKLRYYSTKGSVTITKIDEDNRISGTFEFTAMNRDKQTKKITDGKFTNVKLFLKPHDTEPEDPKASE